MFFEPTSYIVNENAGTVTLTVQTDVPGGPQSGAVQFYTESGSATGIYMHIFKGGQDYRDCVKEIQRHTGYMCSSVGDIITNPTMSTTLTLHL